MTLPPLSFGQWMFLALAGHVALLCGTAIHELAHGLTALALGGDFKDLFISSFSGQAGASAAGQRNVAVLAAGSTVELLAGIAAWLCLRRRLQRKPLTRVLDPGPVLLWLFATQAVLGSIAYIGFAPAVQAVLGLASGDWPLLLGSSPGVRWALFAACVLAVAPLSATFVRSAARLLPAGRGAAVAKAGAIAIRSALSFVLLLLPARLLHIAIAAVLLPWLDDWFGVIIGRTLLILLFAAAGAAWLGVRQRDPASAIPAPVDHSVQGRARADRTGAPAGISCWNTGLAVVSVAVAIAFGPTQALRRGLMMSPASPDDYIGAAQHIRLELGFQAPAPPSVRLCSRPISDAGSKYRRELTRSLARQGPSARGAQDLSAFIARWNLGNTRPDDLSEPVLADGEWCWTFRLEDASNPLQLALWPTTWVAESRITEIRFTGGRLETPAANVTIDATDPTRFHWSRPAAMNTVERFRVIWR